MAPLPPATFMPLPRQPPSEASPLTGPVMRAPYLLHLSHRSFGCENAEMAASQLFEVGLQC